MHWDSITLLQDWALVQGKWCRVEPVGAEWGRVRVGPVRVEWGWGGVGHEITLKQPSRAG